MVFHIFLAVEPFLQIKILTGNPTSQTDRGGTAPVEGVVRLSRPTGSPASFEAAPRNP